jgi:hypothetical protein
VLLELLVGGVDGGAAVSRARALQLLLLLLLLQPRFRAPFHCGYWKTKLLVAAAGLTPSGCGG